MGLDATILRRHRADEDFVNGKLPSRAKTKEITFLEEGYTGVTVNLPFVYFPTKEEVHAAAAHFARFAAGKLQKNLVMRDRSQRHLNGGVAYCIGDDLGIHSEDMKFRVSSSPFGVKIEPERMKHVKLKDVLVEYVDTVKNDL